MSELLSNLNKSQRRAVTHEQGPMLVLAGAGSGKTRVLTYRIAWLIEQGVEPSRILAITFTNKAAGEMQERVRKLLEGLDELPWMGTFHAVCAGFLRRHSHHLGVPNNFSIYDQTDANALIKQAMKKVGVSKKNFNPRAIKATISNAKSELVTATEYQQHARGYFYEQVAKVYPVYQRLLEENQALDFDDLLCESLRLLKESQSLLDYYHQRINYVLVDEYQDTNKAQYELSKLLAQHRREINVVGDAAQSIYAFRGADLRNVNQFRADFPEATVYNLEKNYRSTQKILRVATELIKPNAEAHPVLNLHTDNEEGKDVVLCEASSAQQEAKFVVREVQRLGFGYSDCAILYRTNAQSRQFEEQLIAVGLPYQIVGGVRFYERREIRDLVAYLRLIHNPQDTVSYQRIVNVPPRRIGSVTLKQGGPALDGFHRMMDRFREQAEEKDVLQLLDAVISKVNYKEYIHDGSEEGLSRWENVQELRSVAEQFAPRGPGGSLVEFLESISLLEQNDVADLEEGVEVLGTGEADQSERVTLMTLHAAKGLEFPVVFLVGMEEGLLPHSRSLEDEFDLQEERRLCYVGATRAQKRLYLSYARSRVQYGGFKANTPSRFLEDLPMEVVQYKNLGSL